MERTMNNYGLGYSQMGQLLLKNPNEDYVLLLYWLQKLSELFIVKMI